MNKIEKYKNILLLGIGGIGMSALARFFNSQNKNVFGYDQHQTEITDELLSEGVDVFFDDDVSCIPHVFQKNIVLLQKKCPLPMKMASHIPITYLSVI